MVLKLISVPEGICDYSSQPRSYKPAGYIESLAANIASNGQQVPAIGFMANGRFQVVDGGCRLDAIRLNGGTHLLALDLGKEPSRVELLVAQASIDLHKQHLPPVDRARLYESIMGENGSNGKQTAEAVGISASLLSRYLPLVLLAPDLQAMVNSGQLEWTKGSLIAQATADHDQQRHMSKEAQGMTRDALAVTVRKKRNGHSDNGVKVNRLRIPLDSQGRSVTIAGSNLSLDDAIEILQETLKSARKAQAENLDGKTFMQVMKDKAKAKG